MDIPAGFSAADAATLQAYGAAMIERRGVVATLAANGDPTLFDPVHVRVGIDATSDNLGALVDYLVDAGLVDFAALGPRLLDNARHRTERLRARMMDYQPVAVEAPAEAPVEPTIREVASEDELDLLVQAFGRWTAEIARPDAELAPPRYFIDAATAAHTARRAIEEDRNTWRAAALDMQEVLLRFIGGADPRCAAGARELAENAVAVAGERVTMVILSERKALRNRLRQRLADLGITAFAIDNFLASVHLRAEDCQ